VVAQPQGRCNWPATFPSEPIFSRKFNFGRVFELRKPCIFIHLDYQRSRKAIGLLYFTFYNHTIRTVTDHGKTWGKPFTGSEDGQASEYNFNLPYVECSELCRCTNFASKVILSRPCTTTPPHKSYSDQRINKLWARPFLRYLVSS
jgi:hypothetical protein